MIGWMRFISWLVVISGVLFLTWAALRYSRLADVRRHVAWKLLAELHIRRGVQKGNLTDLDAELDQLEQEERKELENG